MDHIISALSVQKHNPQRINIYLDGEFAFGLGRIVAGWLQVGQSLSDERIAQLQAEDQYETAYLRAINFLNFRPRTRSEIEQKLNQMQTPDEIIDRVLTRLVELGMINDDQFAQTWIENRTTFRPRSRRALTFELRRHGIDDELIEHSLETLNEDELAYKAGQKQARKLENLEWQAFRQKLLAFLARRGFSYETSAPVVARIWAEEHNSEEFLDHDE